MKIPRWLRAFAARFRPQTAAAEAPRVALSGSEFVPVEGASRKWLPTADERIQVTVVLRPGVPVPDRSEAAAPTLSRRAFAEKHAATPESVDKVIDFAERNGLEVVHSSDLRRRVLLAGTRADMAAAFGIKFVHYKHDAGEHRGFKGAVQIPQELADAVEAVLGLNDDSLAQPRCAMNHHAGADAATMTATDLTRLYDFPDADGSGQSIGVVVLAGGYHRKDLEAFFAAEGLAVPEIVEVFIDDGFDKARQGKNDPATREEMDVLAEFLKAEPGRKKNKNKKKITDRAWHTLETTMDVQLLGAFAPGARLVVYFSPSNTADGLFNTLQFIQNDFENDPAIVSMSWGWPEYQHVMTSSLDDEYVPDPVRAPLLIVNNALRSFVEIGVTMCVASGDDLARDPEGRPSVQFPASSPYVLACGGTAIELTAGMRIESETVWNEGGYSSGGGVSRIFERPSWQQGLEVPRPPGCCHRAGRGVPDVAAAADRHSGCRIVVGGHDLTSAGTSAVAPFWAALIARIYHELDADARFVTPWLYRVGSADPSTFRRTAESGNGFYCAVEGPVWNACTGLGGPVGRRLVAALRPIWQPEPQADARASAQSRPPDPEVSPS